jgi:hydroxymethylpyrimidine pyrophosphatase-like HAD family hydrolase
MTIKLIALDLDGTTLNSKADSQKEPEMSWKRPYQKA